MSIFLFLLFAADDLVRNPAQAPSPMLSFTETLRLGDENIDHLAWGLESALAIDEQGNLAILDRANQRLIALNDSGKLLWQVGGKGQGPGEMLGPSDVVYFDHSYYVFDSLKRKVMQFKASDGSLQSETTLPVQSMAVLFPDINQHGFIFTVVQMDAQMQQSYVLKLYDKNWQWVADLGATQLAPVDWSQMGQPGFYVDYLAKQYESIANGFPLGIAQEDHFLCVQTAKYAGTFWAADGRKLGAFEKEHVALPYSDAAQEAVATSITENIRMSAPFGSEFTSNVQKAALAKNTFPDRMSPIVTLIDGEQGFAILRDFDVTKGAGIIDFFDVKGRNTGSANYRGYGGDMLLRGGQLYDLGNGPDELVYLIRQKAVIAQ
ncbi:MAG: 6-bladed beta-propeller [Acidobacteria bacterium]|nr:6-bladed beta-propeller [Acidobacteriota bacterium]